jgi:hypothetical protein
LTTGWVPRSLHSTTSRLLTICALRSSSSSTTPLAQVLERHLHHADGAVDDARAGVDDRLGLLALQHRAGDLGRVGEVAEARFEHLDAGHLQPLVSSFCSSLLTRRCCRAARSRVVRRVVRVLRGEVRSADSVCTSTYDSKSSTSNAACAVSRTRQTTTAPISIGLPRRSLTFSLSLLKLCARRLRRGAARELG